MPARMLFFEGPPGGGKSTLSQLAAHQLRAAQIAAEWTEEHALNDGVFAPFLGALAAGPAEAAAAALGCWEDLLGRERQAVACLDGAFFHSTLKLLLAHDCGEDLLRGYLRALYPMLAQTAPALIVLTGDVERITRAAIAERGAAWGEKVAEDVARYPCQLRQGLGGVEGMLRFFVESQRQLDAIAAAYPYAYHRIDTTAREWARYEADVCALLGVPLHRAARDEPGDLAQYAAVYRPPAFFPPEFNHPLEVELTPDGLRLHMVFARNFRLTPLGADRFALAGRPLVAEFVRGEQGAVSGLIYPFVPEQRFLCERQG